MRSHSWVSVSVLALLVAAAAVYLAITLVGLGAGAVRVGASTAPSGTFGQLELGDGPYDFDYVWNWDFRSTDAESDNVDWGFRFIFGNEASVGYVKDRLDGDNNDPDITPLLNVDPWELCGDPCNMYAYLDDGPEQGGSSNWNPDNGIKNNPTCVWNDGHMRVYGRNDHSNYSLGLGHYVIATTHLDLEAFSLDPQECVHRYRSDEVHEDWWLDRIQNNLTGSPYDWVVTNNAVYWSNGAGTASDPDDIGDHYEQLYHSDGWGAYVSVSGDH